MVSRFALFDAPGYYLSLFDDMPAGVDFTNDINIPKDLIHFFVKDKQTYISLLPQLKSELKSNGMIWVSWPKKASKVVTDITEDIIRNYALSIDLVDIKVCAVDETWSGVKVGDTGKVEGITSQRSNLGPLINFSE